MTASNKSNPGFWKGFFQSLRDLELEMRELARIRSGEKVAAEQYLDEIAGLESRDALFKHGFFLLSVVSALAGAVSLVNFAFSHRASGWPSVFFALLTLFGIVRFLASARADKTKRELKREQARNLIAQVKIDDPSLPEIADLRLGEEYADSGYKLYRLEDGIGCWSYAISDKLMDGPPAWTTALDIDPRLFRGGPLRGLAGCKAAYERLVTGKTFTNESKIGLLSDVLLENGNLPARLKVQRTDYIGNLATNDLAFRRVRMPQDSDNAMGGSAMAQLYDGRSMFLDSANTFRGLANSDCSNQLGVSLLAFADDGYLIKVLQQPASQHSPGLIAPSGSGSFDWEDLDEGHVAEQGFWGWASSHTRELLEELGLDPRLGERDQAKQELIKGLAIRSIPIGFGLYMHRSGKPEVICLTRIHSRFEQIRDLCQYSLTEKKYSRIFNQDAQARTQDFTAAAVGQFCAARLREPQKSVPLEMGYMMLQHLCSTRPKEIEMFLAGPPPK